MKIDNITQPPFQTTLMGALRAVTAHFGSGDSDAVVYGGSGHAFLINVHEALCPSSPYCWKPDGFYPLVRNLGVEMTDLGFFHGGSSAEERAAVEEKLKAHLDAGLPCSLVNMDNQVVYGYDEKAFFTARPWPKNPDYPPGTLTFGTWAELGEEVHACFYTFDRCERADDRTLLADSLRYAIDLHREPEKYEFEKYGIGPRAFDHWAGAAEEHLGSHGNWWNGEVWAECRGRAAEYLGEMAGGLEGESARLARNAAEIYAEIAAGLREISDKEAPADRKVSIAKGLKAREAAAVGKLEELLAVVS